MNMTPGRDEADYLNFLSRHPLLIIATNSTGKIVLDKEKEETCRDTHCRSSAQPSRKGTGKEANRMLI